MKRLLAIVVCYASFSLLGISWVPLPVDDAPVYLIPHSILTDDPPSDHFDSDVDCLYTTLDLETKGLSKTAFQYALKGYQKLLKKRIIARTGYLVICDFSQPSRNKRLYVVDMVNDELLLNTYVAHGRNSGGEYARRFSNRAQSLQSSLGFYRTGDTYFGENGLSLRMTGLEPGFNDKALRRNIVVHGADYMEEGWLQRSKCMGRSYGCPAVPKKDCEQLINTIKNGNCLFIYHPSKNYLKGSKILNG